MSRLGGNFKTKTNKKIEKSSTQRVVVACRRQLPALCSLCFSYQVAAVGRSASVWLHFHFSKFCSKSDWKNEMSWLRKFMLLGDLMNWKCGVAATEVPQCGFGEWPVAFILSRTTPRIVLNLKSSWTLEKWTRIKPVESQQQHSGSLTMSVRSG